MLVVRMKYEGRIWKYQQQQQQWQAAKRLLMAQSTKKIIANFKFDLGFL